MMGRGLDGRRIALSAPADSDADAATIVVTALEGAGATVQRLRDARTEEEWHSGRYAALVVLGADDQESHTRVEQLVREFLVAGKPIGAHGRGVAAVLQAGGLGGRRVAVSGELRALADAAGAHCVDDAIAVDENMVTAGGDTPISGFADGVTREFGRLLEESEVDTMSELSFPASDPPANSPSTVGGKPDRGPHPAG